MEIKQPITRADVDEIIRRLSLLEAHIVKNHKVWLTKRETMKYMDIGETKFWEMFERDQLIASKKTGGKRFVAKNGETDHPISD